MVFRGMIDSTKGFIMKLLIFLSILFSGNIFASSFHELTIKTSAGELMNFSKFKGKPVLLVNIATKCGYTPQLDDLEKLSKKYGEKLVVLGLPSNDFGGQTPEGDAKVAEFCRLNYGVSFPLTTKITVIGKDKHPVYKFLVGEGDEVNWNFEKFLVDKNGKIQARYKSSVKPMSEELIGAIDKIVK